MIELAVFLGNPGSRYARTRHNIAMRMAEAFAERRGEQFQQKFQGRLATIRGAGGLPGAAASPGAGQALGPAAHARRASSSFSCPRPT